MTTTIIEVPPQELDDGGNFRADVGQLEGMAETMRQLGVLEPLLVATQNGGFRIIAGKRRRAAALLAELATVPCIVRDDLSGLRQQTVMAIENLQRKDLTVVEEAEAFAQLAMDGMDEATIASMTGVAPERVGHGMVIAKSKRAAAVTKKHDLSLEHALAIAEFEDDRDVVKLLTVTAVNEPVRFDHTLSRLRDERDAKLAMKAATDKLEAEGVLLYGLSVGYGGDLSKPTRLEELTSVDAAKAAAAEKSKRLVPKAITAAQHRKCPGHAAQVGSRWDGRVDFTYLCLEPKQNGHVARFPRHGGSSSSAPAPGAEAASEARKTTIANNKAWRAAEPVRRAFVRELLLRSPSKLPKDTLLFGIDTALHFPYVFGRGDEAMMKELTGHEAKGDSLTAANLLLENALDNARNDAALLPRVLLLQLAADVELSMSVETWRSPAPERPAAWLSFLKRSGYELAEIEQLVIDNSIAKQASKRR